LPQSAELDRLRVVLMATRNPLNLGAAARAMSNFGALHLRLVNPFDLAYHEARSAVGPAASLLTDAEMFSSLADAVSDCGLVIGTTAIQHRELQHPLRRLDEGGALIRQQIVSVPVAVVFGSEKTGLSNDDFTHCHWLMHIPTRDEHLSMNLGQAVAVTLYEITRESNQLTSSEQPAPAASGELERITSVLLEALDVSGFATPATHAATEEKARRLVRRMNLNARDAEVFLGMLRQVLWKLHQLQRDTEA